MSLRNHLRRGGRLIVLVVLCALVGLTAAEAHAAVSPDGASPVAAPSALSFPLDHFWCYHTSGAPVNEDVQLKDEFAPNGPIGVAVNVPVRFCNPTKKQFNGAITQIQHPNDHLLWYKIGQPSAKPTIHVGVNNQFGKAKLLVYQPAIALAVPTQLVPNAPPKDTDHFECYKVQGQPLNVKVVLSDQFQTSPSLVVASPVVLCNPTLKIHKGVTTNVMHPKAHLVCYNVTPVQFTKNIGTVNQFRSEKPTVKTADLLCVPSKKRIIP